MTLIGLHPLAYSAMTRIGWVADLASHLYVCGWVAGGWVAGCVEHTYFGCSCRAYKHCRELVLESARKLFLLQSILRLLVVIPKQLICIVKHKFQRETFMDEKSSVLK